MDSSNATTVTQDRLQHVLGCNTGPDILSCSRLQIFEIVNFVFLCNTIALFGVIANLTNIIVFYKQGFKSTVNISFFGMAISDLCCLLTLLWVCMCLNPFIIQAGVPWVPEDFNYLPGAWPHVVCGRITSYITIFITAERCLSIITPLKVKQLITPRRATVVVCFIYILNILTLLPEYSTSYFQFTYLPERNATLLGLAFTGNRDSFVGLVFIMSSATGISSFVGVIVCTVVLVVKLQKSSKWRQQAGSDCDGQISSRDKKTVKMVAMIASILIVCYTPGSIVGLATFLEPGLNIRKRYVNLGIAMWSIAFVFQSVNSSVNIILYYNMSSNYRQTFHELFSKIANRKARVTVISNDSKTLPRDKTYPLSRLITSSSSSCDVADVSGQLKIRC